MDKLQAFGSKVAAGARSAASAAASASRAVAHEAATLVNSSPAHAIVGTNVTVAGRTFYVESLLAEGGFGSVYAVSVATDSGGSEKKFVLKKMFAGSPELVQQLSAEVALMKAVQGCAGIVRLLSSERRPVGREGAEINVMMELCPGGHLLTRINALQASRTALPFAKILDIFLQITRPIAFMHAMTPPTAHRDLKVRAPCGAARAAARIL
jgi:serine/threonine protein kinase